MIEWLAPAVGALLLGILTLDLFQTAFHAEGRGGPINQRQNQGLWRMVLWAGRRSGRVRPGVLSLGAPLMAITTIGVWAALLISAFSLVYLPHVLDFHFSFEGHHSAALEAFYYSGLLASTLGQGDVVAVTGWLRALTVVQAMTGFALLTVAVTYVLAVYRELVKTQAVATTIDAHLTSYNGPPRRSDQDADRVSGDWSRSLTFRLTHVFEAHHNFPILYYFRPSRTRRAFSYQIARLCRALQSSSEEQDPLRTEGGADHLSRRVLTAVTERYIEEAHELYVGSESAPGEEDEERSEARLNEILRMLGYEPESGEDEAGGP